MPSGVVAEAGGAGQVAVHAGDSVHVSLLVGTPSRPPVLRLRRSTRQAPGNSVPWQPATRTVPQFGAAVTAAGGPVGVLGELDAGAVQQCLRSLQRGRVPGLIQAG